MNLAERAAKRLEELGHREKPVSPSQKYRNDVLELRIKIFDNIEKWVMEASEKGKGYYKGPQINGLIDVDNNDCAIIPPELRKLMKDIEKGTGLRVGTTDDHHGFGVYNYFIDFTW